MQAVAFIYAFYDQHVQVLHYSLYRTWWMMILHTSQVTERKRRAERARLQYERELEEQK